MPDEKLRLDPSQLTPRDLRRAKLMLEGRNPWELLEDPVDAVVLTIWCLRSRSEPDYTWEQAEDTPLGAFELNEDEPVSEEAVNVDPPLAAASTSDSPPVEPSETDERPSLTSVASTG